MDLGIDKRKLEALVERGRAIAADPVLLRATLAGVLLTIGVFAVEEPQVARLATARQQQVEAQKRADASDDLRLLEKQMKVYAPRLAASADLVEWGDYILEKLEKSGATLHSMDPKKTTASGAFKVVDFDLTAQGTYEQLADFIDRMERGERIVRFDRIFLQRMRSTVNLECTVRGLVKPPKTAAVVEASAHG
jgi:Tfp pilus assembly protein PilO